MSRTVADHFDDEDEFEQLLNNAQAQASTTKEMQFCSDLVGKYDQYGGRMFLSDDQLEWLKQIAGEE